MPVGTVCCWVRWASAPSGLGDPADHPAAGSGEHADHGDVRAVRAGPRPVAVTTHWSSPSSCLTVAGAAWLGLLGTLNATTQLALPDWVRARGLSYYLVVVSVGQAAGGFLWGALATQLNVSSRC